MYDQHYGLSGRPFQLTPDARFWFDTATHRKAMAYLGYGLSQGEGFIVITGDIGAGKTTLVGHLVDTIDADRLNVVRIVSTQIAADDLLRTVCAGLDVDGEGMSKAQMLRGIERSLHAVARGGRRTLLIVDEAQALPVDSLEELRMLSNFQAGGHALLQIFLLGQPEFREKLTDAALEQLRQRVIAMHHLGPMEADELEAYLVHRLSVVDWAGRPDFKVDALATIYAWSGGIPRRINQLVSRVLLHGAIEGIDTFGADDVLTVVNDLDGDGMIGGTTPSAEPELDFLADVPAAAEPEVELEIDEVADAPLWIAADVVVEPTVMEWPFVDREVAPEPVVDWLPIAIDKPEAETRPIDREPPLPAEEATEIDAEPEPVAEAARPIEITAPPRLFERFAMPGRRSLLAPVDPASEADEPASAENPAPVVDLDFARRLAEIERRLEDQDEALRRVLTLLVDWVEGGSARPDVSGQDFPGQNFPGLRDKVG